MKNRATYVSLFCVLCLATFTCCQNKPKSIANKQKAIKPVVEEGANNNNKQLPELTIRDLSRELYNINEECGKHTLTLIDFWASWCGPCRGEMPLIKHLYKTYKDKGLFIIGVSLDHEPSKWKEAITAFNMEWMQLSSLRGWDADEVRKLNINSIPHTILIDKHQNILATKLRGNLLEEFIKDYLSKSPQLQ